MGEILKCSLVVAQELVVRLSPQRLRFDSVSIHVTSVVVKLALGQVLPEYPPPPSINPLVLHSHIHINTALITAKRRSRETFKKAIFFRHRTVLLVFYINRMLRQVLYWFNWPDDEADQRPRNVVSSNSPVRRWKIQKPSVSELHTVSSQNISRSSWPVSVSFILL